MTVFGADENTSTRRSCNFFGETKTPHGNFFFRETRDPSGMGETFQHMIPIVHMYSSPAVLVSRVSCTWFIFGQFLDDVSPLFVQVSETNQKKR